MKGNVFKKFSLAFMAVGILDIVYLIVLGVEIGRLASHQILYSGSIASFGYAVLAFNALIFIFSIFYFVYSTIKHYKSKRELVEQELNK